MTSPSENDAVEAALAVYRVRARLRLHPRQGRLDRCRSSHRKGTATSGSALTALPAPSQHPAQCLNRGRPATDPSPCRYSRHDTLGGSPGAVR
jgi:hypothetical protein